MRTRPRLQIISIIKVTTSKCGMTHSGDVSDLRRWELLVWGVPGFSAGVASSEASVLPGITVVVIGWLVVHDSVIPGVLVVVSMLMVVMVTVMTIKSETWAVRAWTWGAVSPLQLFDIGGGSDSSYKWKCLVHFNISFYNCRAIHALNSTIVISYEKNNCHLS